MGKGTKAKSVFLIDDRLLKMLYLATMDITKNGPDDIRTLLSSGSRK